MNKIGFTATKKVEKLKVGLPVKNSCAQANRPELAIEPARPAMYSVAKKFCASLNRSASLSSVISATIGHSGI